MTNTYRCPYCGLNHFYVPHPTKPGRLVAYCGNRSVCEISGDATPIGLVEFTNLGSRIAKNLLDAGFETVGDLEYAVFSQEGREKLLSEVEGIGAVQLKHLEAYFTKDALKLIVTGTGRCGTRYYAKRLTSAGVPCSHELIGLRGIASIRSSANRAGVIADSSWLAAPYLKAFSEDTKVIHLTRHPKKVIESLMRMRFFSPQSAYNPYREFAIGWAPELECYRRYVDKAAMFYVLWNEMILKAPQENIHWQRIEDDDSALLHFAGATNRQYLFDNKGENHRPGEPYTLSWASIREDVRIRLRNLSARFRYTLEEVV